MRESNKLILTLHYWKGATTDFPSALNLTAVSKTQPSQASPSALTRG